MAVMENNPKRGIERSSLMNVGYRVDYAVRALSYLAAQPPGRIVPRIEIEKKQNIPPHYLSKIMKDLVSGGLVKSHLGCRGGFGLARPAETISIKEVYEVVERPLAIMECIEKGPSYCSYIPVCNQISIWQRAQTLLANFLSGVSVNDIADQKGLRERLGGLHI
ncbi:MAG TPA: Rrf2 family transcriptional regulator [bacterium]|nr:Rrf2 family transcriptional regulator [bacterium]